MKQFSQLHCPAELPVRVLICAEFTQPATWYKVWKMSTRTQQVTVWSAQCDDQELLFSQTRTTFPIVALIRQTCASSTDII